MEEAEKINYRTFASIFKNHVRFEIPFFQRGYAWKRSQWEQLLKDLDENIIGDSDSGSYSEWFFGPVVVVEKPGGPDELKVYEVIDGQQRLTTVYLFLAVIAEIFKKKSSEWSQASDHLRTLLKLLGNETESKDDYVKLKVFSTKGDRYPTFKAVFGETPRSGSLESDLEIYDPLTSNIDLFTKYARKELGKRTLSSLVLLKTALLEHLRVVWIPLDGAREDAQAIFESLNDRGTPLAASELLCSYLFKPILGNSGHSADKLHSEFWLRSQKVFSVSEHFEEFLRVLVSEGKQKMVGKNRMFYVAYKMETSPPEIKSSMNFLSRVKEGAPVFKLLIEPDSPGETDLELVGWLKKISATRLDSARSFLLPLVQAIKTGKIEREVGLALLRETAVLLVRTKAIEGKTTKFDSIFPALWKKVSSEPNKILAIQASFKESGVFISNQEFKAGLLERPLYRDRDNAFCLMFLQELDKSMQIRGQLPDYSTIASIEHVLPQTIDEAWRGYLGDDATSEDLDRLTNNIGNLCLLSQPANSGASNNPFLEKKKEYSEVSALTKELKAFEGDWNIAAIRKRSEKLGDLALKIWSWQ